METKTLSLDSITIDNTLNVREALDSDTIERYMETFDQLPPIVVFDTTEGDLLADGFHRCEAAKRLGQEDIEANVIQGTRQDAEEHAALANLRHGKPLTRKEKRIAVERMLKLRPERSDSWIAEDTTTSNKTVRIYRTELENSLGIPKLEKFIGKDGKEYPREVPHPKKDVQASDEQVDEQPQATSEIPKLDKQPSWRDDASQGVIRAVENNVFSKEVAKALAEYPLVQQTDIAWQIEAMSERPSSETLIEAIQEAGGIPDNFQQWVDEQIVDADVDEPVEPDDVDDELWSIGFAEFCEPFVEPDDVDDEPIEASIIDDEEPESDTDREYEDDDEDIDEMDSPAGEQATEPEPESDELYCDERFLSLDSIEAYMGKTVDVTVSVGRGGGNAQLRGKILDTVEQDGTFMLDFETENGERRQIPTGTARGKPTDAGIVEIRVVEQPQDPTAEEPTEVEVDEVVEEEREAEVTEPVSRRLRDDSTAPRKSLLDELREQSQQAKTSPSLSDIEKREVNLPPNFWTDWNGLIASYKNLMNTCEMKEIAQEMLNTPATQRDFDKIKGFVAVISSLMKKLADTEEWI